MINDWLKYTINKYDDRSYEESEYITVDFANNVLEKIEEILKNKNIIK